MPTNIIYNLDRPNPGNKPSNDVVPMQQNTNGISNIIGVDHLTFGTADSPASDGYHSLIHLVDQETDIPTQVSQMAQLWNYRVNDGIKLAPVLYFSSGTNSPPIPGIQMTRNFAPSISGGIGATFLPGGLILNFGTGSVSSANSPLTVNFTQYYTNANPIILFGNTFSPTAYSVSGLSKTGFVLSTGTSTPIAFTWITIGS